MKQLTLFIVAMSFFCFTNAQNKDNSKEYFQQAKIQLENILNGKETPNYEKAIYTIENAWYANTVDKQNFEQVMDYHIQAIQKIIKDNYNEKDITQKPSLLISQEEIKQQYKQAITNYVIYCYITNTTVYLDSNNISYHKPFHYSSTDPMASNNWENTQVINLNNTKQGNCFALASLFKIFSDRLNSDANLCIAPSHIYIRHKDDKGTKYNVELGSKYFPGTGMISAVTYTTNQAIQNGIAQRELNTTQAVALCLVYLAKGYQHKFNNTTDEFILQCAETALQYDSKNLNAQLLKAEYLENKLTAQHKTIAQLQSQTDFKEYQNLITQLYNEGYREMPLEMKNTLLKLYNKEKVNNSIKPIESISLTFGLFDERHLQKPTERIGNTLFNTKTKKITSFTKDQILYNNYNFDPVAFAWNIDPMAGHYPGISPYSFAANNPIMFTDHKGAFVEGMDGNPVTYKMLTNGKIQWSANASADTKRIGNAMLKTTTGREQFKKMQDTKYPIGMHLNRPNDKRFGSTDPKGHFDDNGKFVVERVDLFVNVNNIKKFKTEMDAMAKGVKDVDGQLKENIKNLPDGEEKQGNQDYLLMRKEKGIEGVIGATGSHEAEHTFNEENLQADAENKRDAGKPDYQKQDIETVPNQIEQKDLNERTKTK